MKQSACWLWVVGLGLLLALAPLSPGLAGEAEKKAGAPAAEETKGAAPAAEEKKAAPKKPAGHVGTIVAVVPGSQTLVVDIPLEKDVLRVGAVATDKTKIEAAGKATPFGSLKEGSRVRINFRRVPTGNELISVEVLGGGKG